VILAKPVYNIFHASRPTLLAQSRLPAALRCGGFHSSITFCLADSMPQNVLKKWRSDLNRGEISSADCRRRIEFYLDQNYGSSHLRDRRIAEVVQETLLKWDGERYKLIAWVIMPNHGHFLIKPEPNFTVSDIMHSIKSFTAHEANRILDRKGAFWAKEYFDRYIRDHGHYASTVTYIENNPVKARLCSSPADWPYGSASFR